MSTETLCKLLTEAPDPQGWRAGMLPWDYHELAEHLTAVGVRPPGDEGPTRTIKPEADMPIGTPVLAWPGTRDDSPLVTRTRSAVWSIYDSRPVVKVHGHPAGIALTHVEVLPPPPAPAPVEEPRLTERQEKAWPEALARLHQYYDSLPANIHSWDVIYADETRPGRGHHINATYADGEVFAQVLMDVYGYPNVSIATIDWTHADSNEECDCEPCVTERAEDITD